MTKLFTMTIMSMFLTFSSTAQWIQQGTNLDWTNAMWYSVIDSNTCYFCADNGGFGIRIFKTTDGNNWTMVYNNNSDELSRAGGKVFPSGIAYTSFDEKLMKSYDGCQSWTQIWQTGWGNPEIKSLAFPSESVGYVFYQDFSPNWIVAKTTDGGATWNNVYQDPEWEFNTYNNAMFLNTSTGCISGYSGNIYRTNNGGLSWTTLTCPEEVKRVFMVDEQTIYAANSLGNNHLYKSTNGGNNWEMITIPTSSWLNDLYFVGNTGWVCTQDGHVFRTADAGATWELQPTPASTLRYIAFADTENGWSLGILGMLIHTTNGGEPLPLPPVITTEEATNVMETSATLNGTVNANNLETTVTFEYGLTTAYGYVANAVPGTVSGSDVTPVYADITGLQENTTYHYRCVGTNSAGTTNGNDMTFTTSCALPGDAGNIRGITDVCEGNAGLAYTIDPIPGATGYNWAVPAGAIIGSGQNTPSITVDFPERVQSGLVSVFGTNDCGPGSESNLEVNVYSVPDSPVIEYVGVWPDGILYSQSASGNQWYLNGDIIPGATNQVYDPDDQEGEYYDIVTINGCHSEPSDMIELPIVYIQEFDYSEIIIFPNPCKGQLNLSIEQAESGEITLTVYNSLGNQVLKEKFHNGAENTRYIINLEGLPDGIYFLKIIYSETQITKKIILRR